METNDLVALQYSKVNHCSIEAVNVDETEHKVDVDLEGLVWSCGRYQNIPIGMSRPLVEQVYGQEHNVIGVYDRTNNKHLESMIRDSKQAGFPASGIGWSDTN